MIKTPHIDIAYADGMDAAHSREALLEHAIGVAVEVADLQVPDHAELSILLAGDETLHRLNQQWRGKSGPTNVLSFPTVPVMPGEKPQELLGDIAISLETAQNEAQLANRPLDAHLSHLAVHGFLHLFGYDHVEARDARIMESLETRILEKMGLPDPYFELMDA